MAISNTSPVTSIYLDSISVQAEGISIVNARGSDYPDEGGGITCKNCAEFKIHSGIFKGLRGKKGGAIYIE